MVGTRIPGIWAFATLNGVPKSDSGTSWMEIPQKNLMGLGDKGLVDLLRKCFSVAVKVRSGIWSKFWFARIVNWLYKIVGSLIKFLVDKCEGWFGPFGFTSAVGKVVGGGGVAVWGNMLDSSCISDLWRLVASESPFRLAMACYFTEASTTSKRVRKACNWLASWQIFPFRDGGFGVMVWSHRSLDESTNCKDRATGEATKQVMEVVNDLFENQDKQQKDKLAEDMNILFYGFVDENDTHTRFVGQVEMIGSNINKTNSRMGEIVKRLAHEFDLSEKSEKIYAIVRKMEGFTKLEKMKATDLLVTTTEKLEMLTEKL
ncbi:hypothetical protein BUALT_Bualt04G0028700 [Buddleja alternifolia]|uniref:Uncharacterized protein n=1 Tax=Buddleja alternifolia TaxID=168488 RepID=A0AAV6XM64_9LAMI|nr:hypothetical protein BUALT_Bualt04G0028700 [Buddleja alternifolia]